jgi:hypothetical protein
LCTLKVTKNGTREDIAATVAPRPKLTNTIGNAQQINVPVEANRASQVKLFSWISVVIGDTLPPGVHSLSGIISNQRRQVSLLGFDWSGRAMCMNYLPFSVHTLKQKRFVAAAMQRSLLALQNCFEFDVGNRSGEFPLNVSFHIAQRKLEISQCIALRFDVMLNQISEPFVLPSGFDVARTLEIQVMLAKRFAISLLPSFFDCVDDRDQCRGIIFLGIEGCGPVGQTKEPQNQNYRAHTRVRHNHYLLVCSSSLLKKPSVAFLTSTFEKRGFRKSPIFNGVRPSKMAAHPCTALSLSKNFVFQQVLDN